MIPLHDVLPGVLTEILRKAPLTPEKVAFAWRQAAGQNMDRVTMVDLRDGVLLVRARDTAWKREVERAIPVLKPRLEAVLGASVVRRIEVTLGRT